MTTGIQERWQRALKTRVRHEPNNYPSGPLRELCHAAGEALWDERASEAAVLLDAFDLLVARHEANSAHPQVKCAIHLQRTLNLDTFWPPRPKAERLREQSAWECQRMVDDGIRQFQDRLRRRWVR